MSAAPMPSIDIHLRRKVHAAIATSGVHFLVPRQHGLRPVTLRAATRVGDILKVWAEQDQRRNASGRKVSNIVDEL